MALMAESAHMVSCPMAFAAWNALKPIVKSAAVMFHRIMPSETPFIGFSLRRRVAANASWVELNSATRSFGTGPREPSDCATLLQVAATRQFSRAPTRPASSPRVSQKSVRRYFESRRGFGQMAVGTRGTVMGFAALNPFLRLLKNAKWRVVNGNFLVPHSPLLIRTPFRDYSNSGGGERSNTSPLAPSSRSSS
jgi:hypothetical protein